MQILMTTSKQSQDGMQTPDDGQSSCPKHAEFYDRIKLDK